MSEKDIKNKIINRIDEIVGHTDSYDIKLTYNKEFMLLSYLLTKPVVDKYIITPRGYYDGETLQKVTDKDTEALLNMLYK